MYHDKRCLYALLHFYWLVRVFRLVNKIRKISHFLYRTLELNPMKDNYFVGYCRIWFFVKLFQKIMIVNLESLRDALSIKCKQLSLNFFD